MTPTQKQAMEMAIEALETELRGYFGPSPRLTRVIEALRAALAEQDDDKADAEIERLRSALCEIANADMTTKGFQMMAREALAGGPVAFGAA